MKKFLGVVLSALVLSASAFAADQENYSITKLLIGTSGQQVSGSSTSLLEGLLASKANIPGLVTGTKTAGLTLTNVMAVVVKDSTGVAPVTPMLARVWMSATAYGAASTNPGLVTVSSGTTLQTITANADYQIITTTNGTFSLSVLAPSVGTNYVNVAVGGKVTALTLSAINP